MSARALNTIRTMRKNIGSSLETVKKFVNITEKNMFDQAKEVLDKKPNAIAHVKSGIYTIPVSKRWDTRYDPNSDMFSNLGEEYLVFEGPRNRYPVPYKSNAKEWFDWVEENCPTFSMPHTNIYDCYDPVGHTLQFDDGRIVERIPKINRPHVYLKPDPKSVVIINILNHDDFQVEDFINYLKSHPNEVITYSFKGIDNKQYYGYYYVDDNGKFCKFNNIMPMDQNHLSKVNGTANFLLEQWEKYSTLAMIKKKNTKLKQSIKNSLSSPITNFNDTHGCGLGMDEIIRVISINPYSAFELRIGLNSRFYTGLVPYKYQKDHSSYGQYIVEDIKEIPLNPDTILINETIKDLLDKPNLPESLCSRITLKDLQYFVDINNEKVPPFLSIPEWVSEASIQIWLLKHPQCYIQKLAKNDMKRVRYHYHNDDFVNYYVPPENYRDGTEQFLSELLDEEYPEFGFIF